MTIIHIVLFEWKASTSPAQVEEVGATLIEYYAFLTTDRELAGMQPYACT